MSCLRLKHRPVEKEQHDGAGDSPQESGSSERSPQSSSRSHVQEMGMQRPLAQGYWFGGHVRAGADPECKCYVLIKKGLLLPRAISHHR